MPFSLSLHLYNLYCNRVQKHFDKNNIVLTQQDIEALLQHPDRSRILRIFRSAVVDHVRIERMSYYLNYPLRSIFSGHDGFKRAVVAGGITDAAIPLTGDNLANAVSILSALAQPENNPGYVQILAWNSLGRIVHLTPNGFDEQKKAVLHAFGGAVGSLTGVLVYCDGLLESDRREEALALIRQGCKHVRFIHQKALMAYYILKRRAILGLSPEDLGAESSVREFVKWIRSGASFSDADACEGLKQTGLAVEKDGPMPDDTTACGAVGKKLLDVAGSYIKAAGAYTNNFG